MATAKMQNRGFKKVSPQTKGGHSAFHPHGILIKSSSSSPRRFGVRFPCMSDAYDRELQQMAMDVGQELGYGDFLKEGVYCVLGGPSFETIAETRMLHKLGADAVGE